MLLFWQSQLSGRIIIFHQPRFPWKFRGIPFLFTTIWGKSVVWGPSDPSWCPRWYLFATHLKRYSAVVKFCSSSGYKNPQQTHHWEISPANFFSKDYFLPWQLYLDFSKVVKAQLFFWYMKNFGTRLPGCTCWKLRSKLTWQWKMDLCKFPTNPCWSTRV